MFSFYDWLTQLPKGVQYGMALMQLWASSLALRYGWFSPWGWTFGLIILWIACFGRPLDEMDQE
jgi:hypothetical protein